MTRGQGRRRHATVLARPAGVVVAALLAVLAVLSMSARAQEAAPDPEAAMRADSSRYIVLAVDNPVQRVPGRAGSSLPTYAPALRYVVGAQAAGVLAALQREHGLQPAAAWPIPALGLHCVVYGLPPQASREALLQALAADPRVRLAQPLQDFALQGASSLSAGTASTVAAQGTGSAGAAGLAIAAAGTALAVAPHPAPDAEAPAYNDPYLPLQRAFVETGAARAHRSSTGRDVTVAIVDTGADLAHPDLQGRVAAYRDLVQPASPRDPAGQAEADLGADRHGTEVAGVIAAVANNGQGIVGMAPGARLALYKACWYPAPLAGSAGAGAGAHAGGHLGGSARANGSGTAGGNANANAGANGSGNANAKTSANAGAAAPAAVAARCNSFTLAKALGAVLDSDARIVNLSLGGPADPLLQALMAQLLRQGRIVVAALPPGGRPEGFPAGVAGVIVVGPAGAEALPRGVLAAPARDVLTLVPGGRYDFASGSSVAAAHASGIAALLLALQPRLQAPALRSLLAEDAAPGQPAPSIRADAALLRLTRTGF